MAEDAGLSKQHSQSVKAPLLCHQRMFAADMTSFLNPAQLLVFSCSFVTLTPWG